MVVLWVVFEDIRLLFVIESPYKFVNTKVFPPFFAVYKPSMPSQLTDPEVHKEYLHLLCMADVELSCA